MYSICLHQQRKTHPGWLHSHWGSRAEAASGGQIPRVLVSLGGQVLWVTASSLPMEARSPSTYPVPKPTPCQAVMSAVDFLLWTQSPRGQRAAACGTEGQGWEWAMAWKTYKAFPFRNKGVSAQFPVAWQIWPQGGSAGPRLSPSEIIQQSPVVHKQWKGPRGLSPSRIFSVDYIRPWRFLQI